jgi:hypothetical protein
MRIGPSSSYARNEKSNNRAGMAVAGATVAAGAGPTTTRKGDERALDAKAPFTASDVS